MEGTIQGVPGYNTPCLILLNKVNKEIQGVLVYRVHQRIWGTLHEYTRCTRVHKVYKSIQGIQGVQG